MVNDICFAPETQSPHATSSGLTCGLIAIPAALLPRRFE